MRTDCEIGSYIETNRESLSRWGEFVSEAISTRHAALLKIPPTPRVKSPESARKKQLKKMYMDPIADMTDLVGVRFVVLTSDDLQPILDTIASSADWSCKQTRNPTEEAASSPETFSYQSHHYEIRPLSGPPLCCEVQVRTLLQHTMAELCHDAIYKADQATPSHAMRLVARSIALMETTDELLCKAMESVRDAQAPSDAIKRESLLQASAIGGGGAELLDDVLQAYGNTLASGGVDDFREFVRANPFILQKISSRGGRGVFAFPASCLVLYWLVSKGIKKVVKAWPYPGSIDDLNQISSDLGNA